MAWFNVHFYSKVLGLTCSAEVILPEADEGLGVTDAVWDGESKLPVLYLLHGLSDDHTIWMRRTSIDRYAAGRRLAVVMPAVHRSWYSDQKAGYRYFTFLTEELPAIMRRFFRISEKREDNFVAGLSMGGYGAMKAGLSCPEKYAAAASMSGALDILALLEPGELDAVGSDAGMRELFNRDLRVFEAFRDHLVNFGSMEEFIGSDNDLMALLERQVKRGAQLPALHISMGTEDFLYGTNVTFRRKLNALRVPYTYMEEPGIHEWAFWDRYIVRVLDWLPVKG